MERMGAYPVNNWSANSDVFANSSITMNHLSSKGMASNDDLVQVRVNVLVVKVLQDLIQNGVGGHGLLVVGVLVVLSIRPLAAPPNESV